MKLSLLFLVALFCTLAVTHGSDFQLLQLDEKKRLCIGVAGGQEKEDKRLELTKCDEHDDDMFWDIQNSKSSHRIHAKEDEHLCWEVKKVKAGRRIKLKDCSSSRRQKWYFDGNKIVPKEDSALCATYKTGNPSRGDNVILDHCGTSTSADTSEDWDETSDE